MIKLIYAHLRERVALLATGDFAGLFCADLLVALVAFTGDAVFLDLAGGLVMTGDTMTG